MECQRWSKVLFACEGSTSCRRPIRYSGRPQRCHAPSSCFFREPWRSKVVIERCRFLDASSCKGMCTGLCKAPSEAYFASIGLPLSMTPNFTDGSCEDEGGDRGE